MDNLPKSNESREAVAARATSGRITKPRSEKIRVELNIEKWPGIWQPAKGHTRHALRTLERQIEIKNEGRAVSKLLIGFTELGTLTTEDQKMFYALIRQWEDAGKPVGKPVYFSDRQLSRLLSKKGWGTNVIEAMTGSLRRLRTIPLRWIKSFHRSDDASSEYEEEIPFQILGDLKIVTRKAHGHVTNQQGYFQFDRHIEANLQTNYTKPLLDEVFFKIEGEIAQLLYTHIDLLMYGKTRYERCTKDLFADLGLTGASYRFKSNRKQKLERALKELRGIRLNHGVVKSATIEETRDGKDYKVVFTKASRDLSESAEDPVLDAASDFVVNHYASVHDPLQLQAQELVCYFHEVFHEVRTHTPQLRETNQALTLIAQHGLQPCRRIVDFARKETLKTNFPAQHFGAILNYVSRAVADHNNAGLPNQIARPAPRVARPSSSGQVDPAVRARGEVRLAALTGAQVEALLEQARQELCKMYPGMARILSQKGSQLHDKTIRGWAIRRLAEEPRDILVLGSSADPEVVRRKLATQNLGL